MKLGDVLVAEEIITQSQLEAALSEQKSTKGKLGKVLVKQGVISEDDLEDVYGNPIASAQLISIYAN